MNAPTMRSSHQDVRRIWRTQVSEVFQSSFTSWSSKIMADGTVESNHLVTGSLHASRYKRVYSSKSATCSPGPSPVSRRERMNSKVPSETSSA
jgi:hypothetical protein